MWEAFKEIDLRRGWGMSEEIFKILLEEFKRNGVKLIGHDFRCDVFISDPADIIHETFERQCTTIPQLLDFSEHDKVFEDKIADLEKRIRELIKEKDEYKQKCNDFGFENQDLKKIIKDYEDKIATLKEKLLTTTKTAEQNRRRSFVLEMKNQDLKNITKGYKDKIAELENIINHKLGNWDKHGITYQEILDMKAENDLLKQRIAELESKETETCEKEPKVSGSAPSIEWYENRHQSDCIEINRLNTTIDVLIHKVEYLRQFAGLE